MKNGFLISLIFPLFVFAQSKNDIFFNFEYGVGISKMGIMNDILADTSYFNSSKYEISPTNTLASTQGFAFEVGYQPFRFQDISVGINYSFCDIQRTPFRYFDDPLNPGGHIKSNGVYHMKLSRLNISLNSQTHFEELFNFEQKTSPFIQRLKLAGAYQIGLGESLLIQEEYFQEPVPIYLPLLGSALNFNGQVACLLGYQLNEGVIISSIQLKIGYNFNFSKDLKDAADKTLLYYQDLKPVPMKLDFSGLHFGLQLTLRK
jgi:hypothetical protein